MANESGSYDQDLEDRIVKIIAKIREKKMSTMLPKHLHTIKSRRKGNKHKRFESFYWKYGRKWLVDK